MSSRVHVYSEVVSGREEEEELWIGAINSRTYRTHSTQTQKDPRKSAQILHAKIPENGPEGPGKLCAISPKIGLLRPKVTSRK